MKLISKKWESDCNSPTGLLIYTSSGYMAAGINCMSKSNNQPRFNPEDITFYMGKYLIKKNKVIHLVQNTSDRPYYGKRLERTIQVLNNNKIILIVKLKMENKYDWNGKKWQLIKDC